MKKSLMVISLVVLFCFTFGCQNKEAMAELEAMKAQAEVEEQNKEIVSRGFNMCDEGNIEGLMMDLAPNSLWYSPSNSPAPMSKEELRELLVVFYNAFTERNQKIEEIMAVGDKVIVRVIAINTHTKEYRGIPATGKKPYRKKNTIWSGGII